MLEVLGDSPPVKVGFKIGKDSVTLVTVCNVLCLACNARNSHVTLSVTLLCLYFLCKVAFTLGTSYRGQSINPYITIKDFSLERGIRGETFLFLKDWRRL